MVEIGLGCGFLGSGWLFRRLLSGLAAAGERFSVPLTEFMLNLTLLTLLLPIAVILLRRWLLGNRTLLEANMRPTLNTQLVGAGLGLPIVVAIGVMTARLPHTETAALPALIMPLVGLITGLIPLGMAMATGHRRFYTITIVVALSGFLWRIMGLSLSIAGLTVWIGLGLLLLLSGLHGFGRYWLLTQPRHQIERRNDTV